MRNTQKSKTTVAAIVTDRIISMLERGVIPWRKKWHDAPAINYVTQVPYTGINMLLLDRPGEYITFKQLQKLGGWLKKGTKSYVAVKYINKEEVLQDPEDPNSKVKEGYRFMRYFNLFHITDCLGIESRQPSTIMVSDRGHNHLEEVERLIQSFQNVAPIKTGYKLAAYYPTRDVVYLPDRSTYESAEDYYCDAFHELIHSTGHASRLNREGIAKHKVKRRENSAVYAKEELIAEMGAAILCTIAQMDHKTIEDSASYIKDWLSVLHDDTSFITKAAAQAQAAINYIIPHAKQEEAA